jgi:hypothetical protein
MTRAQQQGCPWDRYTCEYAALGGHLDCLKFARLHGCPWDKDTCAGAARYGHLEVLQWARANECPCDHDVITNAMEYGHLELLKWAWGNGFRSDIPIVTCNFAATGGSLEVMKYAREVMHCPWDPYTLQTLASGGRLDVMRWARANGCPWDGNVGHGAAHHGHFEAGADIRQLLSST